MHRKVWITFEIGIFQQKVSRTYDYLHMFKFKESFACNKNSVIEKFTVY